jgi:predicted transposase YbfD/YdcC
MLWGFDHSKPRACGDPGEIEMVPIYQHFADMEDPRVSRTRVHPLPDILVLTILAVICGADSFVAIERFGKAKEAWLRSFLELPGGIPSHDTIGRVFSLLDADRFTELFMSWVASCVETTVGQVIAVDGKTVRGSVNGAAGLAGIHLVSAWATANHVVLGQVKTAAKSNEITAIPDLLDLLEVSGCIITIDAMGCQKAIAAKIREHEADYLLQLKENHPTLFGLVDGYFADGIATAFAGLDVDFYEQVDRGHNRDEHRRTWVTADLDWLPESGDWVGMKSLVCVESTRTPVDKPTSVNLRYYLSSIENPTAEKVAKAVRAHWGIENEMHWVLDVGFREDHSRVRIGNAAENLAVVRRIALNLLKQEETAKVGIKNKRLMAGWDHDYLLKVLAV